MALHAAAIASGFEVEALRASLEKKAPLPAKAEAKPQPETRKPPKRARAADTATRKAAKK